MELTVKNHHNPCFWTAHWNRDYLEQVFQGQRPLGQVRTQQVSVLNVQSNKIYRTVVENVHFDKHLGIAEITPDAAKAFCQRHFPEKYEAFCLEMERFPETAVWDFESVLSSWENSLAYRILLRVIQKGRIDSLREKGEMSLFLLVHLLRSHALMKSLVEAFETSGRPKFEYFWFLKHSLSNPERLHQLVIALTTGRWQFYRLSKDSFPLVDSPILIQPGSLMVALSPRLLLEIDRTDTKLEEGWVSSNHISSEKLDEFRRRTIGNTFREIIFSNPTVLGEWQNTPEFANRHKLMSNTKTYNTVVGQYLDGDIWKINAHGNAK